MQYLSRKYPVFEATAAIPITVGTLVVVTGTNTGFTPNVTTSSVATDVVVGVAMGNYPQGITSGSIFNVAASGVVIEGKLGSAVNCGGTLLASGSLGTFVSGSLTNTTSTWTPVIYDAVALQSGASGDVIQILYKS